MAAELADAFSFLREQIHAAFGNGTYAWFPAIARGTTYTVQVECTPAPVTARTVSALGLVSMPDDGIVLHLKKEDCPYPPRPGHLFIIGATATGNKYVVINATGAEGLHSHYRVVAALHQKAA